MRLITDVLRDIRKGKVVEVASEKLAELTQAVLDTNKGGKLTIVMEVKPQGRGDNAIIMSVKVESKIPELDLPEAIFFADLDGNLLREDPTQTRMFADSDERRRDAQ